MHPCGGDFFFHQAKNEVKKKEDQGDVAIGTAIGLTGAAALGLLGTVLTGGALAPVAATVVTSGECPIS